MIFAKLDVCFWRHKKFRRAGAAACGYYAAALAYLREDETRDVVLEADDIGQILNVGEREAAKLLERLVDVGLFERVEGGYLLLRYAEKNETRDAIEARRAATRERVGEWRKTRRNSVHVAPLSDAGNALHNDDCNALHADEQPSAVTRIKTDQSNVCVPGSDSLSVSGSDPEGVQGEPEPFTPSTPEPEPPPPHAPRLRSVPLRANDTATAPPDDIPIDADLRGRCVMAGYPEPTKAHVAAMLARARSRGLTSYDWPNEVVLWMARERQFGRSGPAPETDAKRAHTMSPAVKRPKAEPEQVPAPDGWAAQLDAIGGG